MSYSFSVRASSKAEAKDKIAAELDTVVTGQPVHAADRKAAQAAAEAFVDLLVDPVEGQLVNVSVSGSLGWRDPDGKEFTSSNVSVYGSIVADG